MKGLLLRPTGRRSSCRWKLADVVSPATRSRMMSGIRGKDTKPELAIRRGLHALGFRYRLHARDLPGKPDIVLPRWRAVIFVHGCFWHGHDCHLFKWPKTRTEFWRQKITTNRQNDEKAVAALHAQGWRVLIVWECALKGRTRRNLDRPGDALREISRIIEWDLFRDYQRRERAVELVRLVLGDVPSEIAVPSVIRRLIDTLPAIDALMLSASQQRKSRAGYSYEHHIEAMLSDGGIPFEKQVIIEARKRPDFILPSLAFVERGTKHAKTGLILSAKTTLRERWKQVEREKGKRRLFLTTVDENIAGSSIEDMASFGVHLVIPESLRLSKETEYKDHKNVVSFKEFCSEVIQPNLKFWSA